MTDIVDRLRKDAAPSVEYRVADPADGAYCVAYRNPVQAAEWLADHRRHFPDGRHAHYEVQRAEYRTEAQENALEAADTIDALDAAIAQAESAGLASCVGCGAPQDEQHMPNCPAVAQAEQAQPVAWQDVHDPTDLYWRQPPEAGPDVRPLYAAPVAHITSEPARREFEACGGVDIADSLERLRFFCSMAMESHDWLEAEQFFIALESARTVTDDDLRAMLPWGDDSAPAMDRWLDESDSYGELRDAVLAYGRAIAQKCGGMK